MKILVTGGAGFIGRWVVGLALEDGHEVLALDNLSNGARENLAEFVGRPGFLGLEVGDIKSQDLLKTVFSRRFDICLHLGASINVQDSLDDPRTTFDNDVTGTFNILECCRETGAKMVFMSTCMVYDRCSDEKGISEGHSVKPASPYAGAKLSGEHLTLSYYWAYGLPTVVARPFNTYGPFQKTGGEGGVVAIFTRNALLGKTIEIYGDGSQTRDLLYVADCARFILACGCSDRVNGLTVNAGNGRDVSINRLAEMVSRDRCPISHVPHIHPQSEITKLLCNNGLAAELLGWKPEVPLETGLKLTEDWIRGRLG